MLVSNRGEWSIHPTFYDGVINETEIRLKSCTALVECIDQKENPPSDQYEKITSNSFPVHANCPPVANTDENKNNNSSNLSDLDKIIDEANSIKEEALEEMSKRISDSVDSLKLPFETKSVENMGQDNEADQEEMSSRMAAVLEVFNNKVDENLSLEEEAEKRFLIQELLAYMDEAENNENRVGDIIPLPANDYTVAQSQLGEDDGEGVIVPQQILGIKNIYDTNGHGLKVGYYHQTCPEAEEIISETVAKAVKENAGVTASLIRMHFHDCFVRGCDGSILLDSSDNTAEKDSPVNNPSLRGYDTIDEAKAKLEAKCAGVISCADVVAFAARDSAYQAGGLFWAVEGGRRDGRISRESEVTDNIPSPSFDVSRLTQFFASKQLSQEDMVTLSGAHSIGVSHCSSFTGDRLYNFSGRGGQDPSMDSNYALQLKAKCPTSASTDIVVPLDPVTPTKLDAKYFVDLQDKRGLLESDQTLMSNDVTYRQVNINAKYPTIWRINFGRAMVKMGAIDVLTGSQGEIRKQCRVPN
ncbi:hypothetical protein SUGI_0361300 [Cryptomeria japonica]|nr:hypothetical protein SUGI_0361300 [Cryptomeria japonica]